MRFGKLLPFLLLLLLIPFSCACAAAGIQLTPEECAVSYSVDLPDQDFLLLSYTAPKENGKMVIYAPDGHFEGSIPLRFSQAGGTVKITINSFDGKRTLASGSAALPAANGYQAPSGKREFNTLKKQKSAQSQTGLYFFVKKSFNTCCMCCNFVI